MIIGQSDSAKIKKFITGIVLASLLINFSLFFTKLMIDASNIATIGLYNSILSNTESTDTTGGLSNAYQQSLGTQGFLSGASIIQSDSSQTDDNYNYLVITVMASVLILVTSFVFFAISVLFVVRYIILILLLILSPLGFVGMALGTVLPSIKKYADDWWDSLWGQLLFAPIYMLMTWVTLTLITSPNFTGIALDPAQWASFGQGPLKSSGSIPLLLNFAIVIGLAIASLVISKKFATQGAAQIKDFSGKAMTFAGGAIMGNAAKAGRATLGRAGNAIANSERLKNMAVSDSFVTRKVGQWTMMGGDKAAKSTFDIRSAEQFKGLAKTAGVDFGKGADAKKVSFQKDLEAKGKAEAEFAKMLKGRGEDEAISKLEEEKKGLQEEASTMQRGTEKFRLQNEAKAIGEQIKDIKKVSRVEKYAKTFENESAAWRYTKNAFKVPLGAVSSLSPTTKADNQVIAKAIRKGEKSKGEKIADIVKEMTEERAETPTETPPVTPPTPPPTT